MTDRENQRDQLRETIKHAKDIRHSLQHLLESHPGRVHFRPSSGGVTMVGLIHELPQRGKQFGKAEHIANDFEALFKTHCEEAKQGRDTPEKQLQSFLIRESYTNNRRLKPINDASKATDDLVELVFVTDEVPLPHENDKKIVCDILALRRDGGKCTPVLLELKSSRDLTRLLVQVKDYSTLIDEHADLFAELFGVLLDEKIHFDGAKCEKWIVWPVVDGWDLQKKDPREDELRTGGVRCVTYEEKPKKSGVYEFRIGAAARG